MFGVVGFWWVIWVYYFEECCLSVYDFEGECVYVFWLCWFVCVVVLFECVGELSGGCGCY